MQRNVSLEEISDGKLYEINDLVKADCNGCEGCSACCKGMGTSIVLDPLDIDRLTKYSDNTFEELLVEKIELNVVDGIILPNLKMSGPEESCSYLNNEGRCTIHPMRPGICRLFPLGRYYENQGYKYILQTQECTKKNKTKIKVRKWIDTPDLKDYEQFIKEWHYFRKEIQAILQNEQKDHLTKELCMYLLKSFYIKPYHNNFYEQFHIRVNEAKQYIESVLNHI